jgi:hypothetical protein
VGWAYQVCAASQDACWSRSTYLQQGMPVLSLGDGELAGHQDELGQPLDLDNLQQGSYTGRVKAAQVQVAGTSPRSALGQAGLGCKRQQQQWYSWAGVDVGLPVSQGCANTCLCVCLSPTQGTYAFCPLPCTSACRAPAAEVTSSTLSDLSSRRNWGTPAA